MLSKGSNFIVVDSGKVTTFFIKMLLPSIHPSIYPSWCWCSATSFRKTPQRICAEIKPSHLFILFLPSSGCVSFPLKLGFDFTYRGVRVLASNLQMGCWQNSSLFPTNFFYVSLCKRPGWYVQDLTRTFYQNNRFQLCYN